jgi:hypothetical protein
VPDHPDVGSLGRVGVAHRVGESAPPISTSNPRERTASRTARIVRGETEDSTNSAGMRRRAMSEASSWTSRAPASAAVEIPCRPITSNPYARPKYENASCAVTITRRSRGSSAARRRT